MSAAETRHAAASHAGVGSAERDGRLGRLRLSGPFLGGGLGMDPAPGRHPLPSWGFSGPKFHLNEKLQLSPKPPSLV